MYVTVIFIQLVLLLILCACWLYFLSMLVSDLFGVPFVPTRQHSLKEVFQPITFGKKDVFFDLGAGDGRLVFFANRRYGIKAVGIELNPILYLYSRFKARVTGNQAVKFYRRNFFDQNLSEATVIYLFLFPEVVNRLYPKFKKECKKGTIIISHGFQITALSSQMVQTLTKKPFSTYYYRL